MLVHEFLQRSARKHPDKVALIAGDVRWTFSELDRAANRLAHAFIDAGLERGDRVAIFVDNSPHAVVALFAALKAGGVFMMVNPTTKADKLRYILANSRAGLLFTDRRRHRVANAVLEGAQHLRAVVVADGMIDLSTGITHLDAPTLHDTYAHLQDTVPRPGTISVDLAALIYTSGSTGDPKGVMLTHRNMDAAARSVTTYLDNVPDDIIICVLPLSFDYGLYQVLMAMRLGATVVLEKSFTFPHAVMQKVVAEKVTGLPLVPTMSAILLDMDLSKYDLSRLRYITNTAAALPTEHIKKLRALLPEVTIYSMYGLTECKRVSYLPPAHIDDKPDSVGIPIPDTETFILGEDGQRLPPGEVGELVVRGAHVMSGYWENPDATQRRLKPGALPGEQWLYTGDLFRADAEGLLYFVGRTDDIIKSRGEKVPPKEIENVLYQLQGVLDAVVFGLPDPVLGEMVIALVARAKGMDLDEKTVLRHCRAHLEDFMVPGRVEVRDVLPKNPSGKIDKKVLRNEMLQAEA